MNDEADDMPILVQKGYDTGTAFMGLVTSAQLFSIHGKNARADLPDISNRDPDWIRGFNAGVSDFLQDFPQDRTIDWRDIFGSRLHSYYETR